MQQPVPQCVLAFQLARLVEIANSNHLTVQDVFNLTSSPACTEGRNDVLQGAFRNGRAIVLHFTRYSNLNSVVPSRSTWPYHVLLAIGGRELLPGVGNGMWALRILSPWAISIAAWCPATISTEASGDSGNMLIA